MRRAFLDTNILLDYYLDRQGADAAERLFEEACNGQITLLASTLTFATFAYVVKKEHSRDEVYAALDEVEQMISALPVDRQQLRLAIDHPCKDFEDMLQYQCAFAAESDAIITNNKKDFLEFSQLPLYTAEEYLNELMR